MLPRKACRILDLHYTGMLVLSSFSLFPRSSEHEWEYVSDDALHVGTKEPQHRDEFPGCVPFPVLLPTLLHVHDDSAVGV